MDEPIHALLDQLEAAPQFVLEALGLVPEAEWGNRPPGGELSLRELVEMMLAHDRDHCDQITQHCAR